jgi:hypothetical protein
MTYNKLQDQYNITQFYASGGEVVFPDDRLNEEASGKLSENEDE